MKIIRYTLLTLIGLMAFKGHGAQITEEQEKAARSGPPQLLRQKAQFEGLTPFLQRQKAIANTPDYVKQWRREISTPQRTIEELEAEIATHRKKLNNKARQRGRLRNGLKILVSDPHLVELEGELEKATKALRSARSSSSSTRRKLSDNVGDTHLSARLRNHTQRAQQANAQKLRLEQKRDALLLGVADNQQQEKLNRLNKENGRLGQQVRQLETELDKVLTQR